jgi:hypothetical protein
MCLYHLLHFFALFAPSRLTVPELKEDREGAKSAKKRR